MRNFMECYPSGTASVVQIDRMYLLDGKRAAAELLSTRLVKCAAMLSPGEFLGWQLSVPRRGLIGIALFGTEGISTADLEWAAEKTGKFAKQLRSTADCTGMERLYEIALPAASACGTLPTIGFGAESRPAEPAEWPLYISGQFCELVETLRLAGGMLRAVLAPADAGAQQLCRKAVQQSYHSSAHDLHDYIGTPVKMRVLLRLPEAPSVRLRTVLNAAVPESELRFLGEMSQAACAALWDAPMQHAPVLPDIAARILMIEPMLTQATVGIEVCKEAAKKIPASHKNTQTKHAVTLGRAADLTGAVRKITVGETDLRRHYQIVGQTGTGKSTMLTTIILSAIEQGHGLTFFDPHGSTIETVLHAIPAQYAGRVRVVHIGDAENPVPMNIWSTGDPEKEEQNIANLCELFGDIFNPPGEIFCGPRYERWLATFAKASLALLGKRASLESIAVLSQTRDNMKKLGRLLADKYPQLASTILEEYASDRSSDFQSTLNWYLSKFERLTSVEQLRVTLGAGANALDFRRTIDTDTVTLIDLASPVIGTTAARVVGTILLMQLWNAVTARKERDRTHLAVVDEAALFQTEPMPRILAEARKFGLSMVLCHQHTGQLRADIREALEANSANFSAFRLSPRDAAHAAIRFDDAEMQTHLARLDAYQAVTTLSVDGAQTAPFTLETIPAKKQKQGEKIAAEIEAESRRTLVEPYREMRALTPAEILAALDRPLDEDSEPEQDIDDDDCELYDEPDIEDELTEDADTDDADDPAVIRVDGLSEATLKLPIEELELSVRSFNCLKRAGISTVGGILAYGDLSRVHNLGRRCVEEIRRTLQNLRAA